MLRLSDLFLHARNHGSDQSNPAALRAVEALPPLPVPPHQGPNLLLLCPCEIAR